ncbi:MAG: hypothetical protein ACREPV_07035 [Lysobacter sp.]
MKAFLSRLGLSSRQKQAEQLIDGQVKAGNVLAGRLENLRKKEQPTLPRYQWVPNEEFIGWKENGQRLVIELFGDPSEALSRWRAMLDADPPSSPYGDDPVDLYLNRVHQVNAFLSALKHDPFMSRNAVERIRDKWARHPRVGPVLFIAGLLVTGFGLLRGGVWLFETLFR